MERLRLQLMTRELCHRLFRDWTNDESVYADMSSFRPFVYDEEAVNRYFDSRQDPSRIMFALMLSDEPIGEVQLKQIDRGRKECALSIHLQNDTVKNMGYGTKAEKMAVEYAFKELGMVAVNADTIIKNTRSQRVLEKAGFKFVKEEGLFRYYRIER